MKFTSEMILLLVLSMAAVWDYSLYVVPNEIIVLALIVGFAFNPCIEFLIRIMLTVLMLLPLRKIKILGAGDIKVLAIMCAYLGMKNFISSIRYLLIATGVICLIFLIRDGKIIEKYKNVGRFIGVTIKGRRLVGYEQKSATVVPLNVSFLIGYVMFLLCR